MSGQASVEFKATSVVSHILEPSDFVYVPAGTPHRLMPHTESVQLRYKATQSGLEGIAWYGSDRGVEVWREECDTAQELPREGCWCACQMFNPNNAKRVCGQCGATPPTGVRWPEIAAAIRSEQD